MLRPHAEQQRYWNSPHRFNVVPSGRRSGKTELAKRKTVKRALRAVTPWKPRFFLGAPTRDQAKRIFWDDLKSLVPMNLLADKPSESDLMIEVINGAQLWVVGLDVAARMEGQPWDGGVIDEIGNAKPEVWGANIRPALSDRKGWCDLIGVPEGRNHYYSLANSAQSQMKEGGDKSAWGYYHWKSADILDAEEIAQARQDLDPLTFKQEYEGSFVNFEGRAYYVFNSDLHTAPLRYDPKRELILCFDFNVDPGVCAVCQEQPLPGQYERDAKGLVQLDRPIFGTGVIGEVYIEQNSNTPAVCRKVIQDWGQHEGRVTCYGDATGGARGSAKIQGSDWDLIKATLNPQFGSRITYDVPSSNPSERSRLNAMNSRLQTASGVIRMMVDGAKAPHVVKDLDGVVLLKGGSGELDKKATPKLTHMSDGLGYYIAKKFPIIQQVMHQISMGGT
jgi:hypothetical protein